MARHRDRIYVLERQKKDMQALPADKLEGWQAEVCASRMA
jgi:hypothetical protein